MKYTTLGRAGVKVSRACLGTMNFGTATDKKESFAIMDAALEHGVNFFDTADFYGDPPGQGVTESIVGDWLAQSGNRDRVVLVTKAYATMGRMEPNDRGLSAYHLRRACEASLSRLRTDHIDVYMMHHYDRGFRFPAELANIGRTAEDDLAVGESGTLAPSFEEILDTMQMLRMRDKISYIGSANFPAWALTHFNALARERGMTGSVVEQCHYNLACRKAEVELIPACRALGVGMMTYSPLEGGLLAGWKALDKRGRYSPDSIDPARRAQLEAYDKLCEQLGEKPADVSLAWILHCGAVTSVMLGPRSVEQLKANLHAVELELPADFVQELEKIWPGPGAEAPEFYGW